jgi:hypothetical protein
LSVTSTTAIFIDSNPTGARDGFVFSGGGLADRVADNSNELNETIIATGFTGITDLKVGPDGRLYVVSFGDGKIYAISNGGTAPLSIGLTGLPKAEVGAGYNVNLNISGGAEPYVVSVDAGALPAGLNLVGGALSGTPTVARKARFTLRVSDDVGASMAKRFNLTVVGAVSINNQALPLGRVGRRYSARLKAKAGKKPYAWSLVAGAPTAVGDSNLTFRVTDPLGGVAQKILTLSIR